VGPAEGIRSACVVQHRSTATWPLLIGGVLVHGLSLDRRRFSSVLSRQVHTEEVTGSNPVSPTLTSLVRVKPARLYESPYTDHGHVDVIFPDDFEAIVDILRDVRQNVLPSDAA
jgi:hypothetical protein